MTVEQKVIASVRKIMLADAQLNAIVSTNIYASHISSIIKPVYPAISLHLLSSGAHFADFAYVEVNLQIDAWFPTQQYDMTHVLNAHDRIRSLLHRQRISDTTIPVIGVAVEKSVGPAIVEEDTKLIHLPTIYYFTAS